MDYHRIYREFIADRKANSRPDGYTERHHILPRSLGGDNSSSNLIDLTAEDHVFAHVLLAKMHGGVMWAPVIAIFGQTIARRIPTRREIRLFALARQKSREAMKGAGNPFYGRRHSTELVEAMRDGTVYELSDGKRVVGGTRHELVEITGVDLPNIARLVVGARKNAKGWYSTAHNPDGVRGSALRSQMCRSKDVVALWHHDGRRWAGTRVEFREQFGARLYFQSGDGHVQGWYRSAEQAAGHEARVKLKAIAAAEARGCIAGSRNPMAGADRRKDAAVHLIGPGGAEYKGSLKAFADNLGIGPSHFATVKKTFAGKRFVGGYQVKSWKGWRAVAFRQGDPLH